MNFANELYGGILTGRNVDPKECLYYLVRGLTFHRPDVSFCEINTKYITLLFSSIKWDWNFLAKVKIGIQIRTLL